MLNVFVDTDVDVNLSEQLSKSLATSGRVPVSRVITRNGRTFPQIFWVLPGEARKTDKVMNPKDLNIVPASNRLRANNSNQIRGWSTKNLDLHFGSGGLSDHSEEYPGLTKEQYANKAKLLASAPVGGNIVGFKALKDRDDGAREWFVVRYHKATNDFVKTFHNGVVTMFQPTRGYDYYLDQLNDGGVNDD